MSKLQKSGGLAALFEALAYIVGFVVMATLLNPGNTTGWSPAQKLAFVLENKALFQAWTLFIYVAFGIALVILSAAMHECLRADTPDLMKVATPFGFIWAGLVIASGMVGSVGLETVAKLYPQNAAQAVTSWQVIGAIQNGLGGGVEVVGGVWVLLVSFAAIRSVRLSRALGYLGVLVGLSGIVSVVPMLAEDSATVFGLSQILWFIWIGVTLLRWHQPRQTLQPSTVGVD